jgi:hypothetical protein
MPTDDAQKTDQLAELQKAALAALRQQQEALLSGVKAWREALANSGTEAPAWPELKPPGFVPKPAELVEASYAFTAKLLAEQSRFLTELGKAMTAPNKKK